MYHALLLGSTELFKMPVKAVYIDEVVFKLSPSYTCTSTALNTSLALEESTTNEEELCTFCSYNKHTSTGMFCFQTHQHRVEEREDVGLISPTSNS